VFHDPADYRAFIELLALAALLPRRR